MIVPKRTTIGELYSVNARLQVPRYQRRYDWGKNELLDMMSDLRDAMASETPMYLGNFVFDVSGRDESGGQIYSIVDGQQRITSFTLLLIACREKARELGKLELAQEIQKKISFTDATTGKMISERVLTSPQVSDVFAYAASESWGGDFPAKIGSKAVKRQSNKLKPLYTFMKSAINDLDSASLSKFLAAVYGSYVIQVDIQNEIEAFDIFERMNARGLSLNVADLVKNYLYAKLPDDSDFETQWDDITRNAGGTLQRMLKYFWVAQNGPITQKELYRKLKGYGNTQGASTLTGDLNAFSAYYAALQSDDKKHIGTWLRSANCEVVANNDSHLLEFVAATQGINLFKITQHFPLIYSITCAFKRTPKSDGDIRLFLRLIRYIENYHFVNNQICDRVGNEVERAYGDFAKEFWVTSDMRTSARKFVSMLLDKRAPETEFATRFAELEYPTIGVAETCYIFDRINNHGRKPTQWFDLYNPDPDIVKKNFNTEHFLSQNPDFTVSNDDMEVVNNIGNLFIISRHTNSQLQNKPPIEKIELLDEYGRNMNYIVEFVRGFREGPRSWGRSEIIQRGSELALQAYRDVWGIQPIP